MPGQKSWWAAPITARSISSASMPSEASPPSTKSSALSAEPAISERNPTEAPWPGSCNAPGRVHSPGGEGNIPAETPVEHRGSRSGSVVQRAENTANRARAAFVAVFACLLAGLALVAWPGNADSAPARVLVLGQTAETPPPTCPGKIVNGVEVIPCRVEGHVTGFQAMAGGVAAPYEAPFDGKIVAWSITLARPSSKVTKTTSDEISYFNDFLGQPSEARIGILRPVEDSKPP